MIQYSLINGELIEKEKASLKLSDLALLRGYGAFDFFLLEEGRCCFVDDHLDRFFKSASLLGLHIPYDKQAFKDLIERLVKANGLSRAGIRLLLTGGYAVDGYTPVEPNVIIMEHPPSIVDPQKYETGVKLITHQYQRDIPQIKTINYLMGIYLRNKLKQAGAIEPLYHNGHEITECVRSNFFIINNQNVLVTPSTDILEGITRKQILKIAPQVLDVEVRTLRFEELKEAKESFISGSNKGIMPVVQIDDWQIGDGEPGKLTKELAHQLARHKSEMIHNQPSIL